MNMRSKPGHTTTAPWCWQEKTVLRAIDSHYRDAPRERPSKSYTLAVYLALAWTASDRHADRFCVSQGRLADRAGCSERTAASALRLLEYLGCIAVRPRFDDRTGGQRASEFELVAMPAAKSGCADRGDLHDKRSHNPPAHDAPPRMHVVQPGAEPGARLIEESPVLEKSLKSKDDDVRGYGLPGRAGPSEDGMGELYTRFIRNIYQKPLREMWVNLLPIKEAGGLLEEMVEKAASTALANLDGYLRLRYIHDFRSVDTRKLARAGVERRLRPTPVSPAEAASETAHIAARMLEAHFAGCRPRGEDNDAGGEGHKWIMTQ